jgi:hypothetical protein
VECDRGAVAGAGVPPKWPKRVIWSDGYESLKSPTDSDRLTCGDNDAGMQPVPIQPYL